MPLKTSTLLRYATPVGNQSHLLGHSSLNYSYLYHSDNSEGIRPVKSAQFIQEAKPAALKNFKKKTS